MLILNPKSLVTKASFFNCSFVKPDFSARFGFREFQVDLIKSLYESGSGLRGPRNLKNGTWADFKSLYESGSALRWPRNLKIGTWADFKSLYESGSALRGPRNLKNGTHVQTCTNKFNVTPA